MEYENQSFVIVISPLSHIEDIEPLVSDVMNVIRHKLVIQKALPDLWYKDEGGRDKCMVLPIALLDASGAKVMNRQLRLKVSLLYENAEVVLKQEILKISPESTRIVNIEGEAILKFRIEDVSKNHQGQNFRVKVEGDTTQSPMNFDVACAFSNPVGIRSKRNKRARTKSFTNASPVLYPSAAQQAGSTPVAMDQSGTGEYVGASLTEDEKARVEGAAKLMDALPVPGTLNGSMNGIIQWASTVVSGLHALEWQVIGHESNTDGTPNQTRPLYRCPSCWRYKDVLTFHSAQHGKACVIATILMQYATQTMMHLHTVLQAIDGIPSPLPTKETNPPEFVRGISDMIVALDLPNSLRETTDDEDLAGFDESLMPSFDTDRSTRHSLDMDNYEIRVFYVVAKMQCTAIYSDGIGFPAFDVNQQLVGYYQEGHDQEATQILFLPLVDIQYSLTQNDIKEAHALLVTEAKGNTGAVHRLDICEGNLAKLKEDSLMYHWSHNVDTLTASMAW